MTLSSLVSRDVAHDVKERGQGYYRRGAVHILSGDAWMVEARVEGTDDYRVELVRETKEIFAWCTCPYFQDRERICKHIWATVLAAEAKGYLQGRGHTGRLRLKPDVEAADEYWAEDEAQDGWDGGPGYDDPDDFPAERTPAAGRLPPPRPQARPKSGRSGRSGRKKRGRRSSWKQSLASVRDAMAREPALQRDAWPANREILYIVDVAATLQGRGIMVEVAFRTRKKDGTWGKPKTQRLTMSQISHLPDAADREALALLCGPREENGYGYNYGYSYYDSAPCRYRLVAPMDQSLLPVLCRTGRCRLRLSADDPQPRPIAWDDGPPWEFWLKAGPDPAGKNYTVTGQLRRGDERVSLADAVMVISGGLVFWEDRVARLDDGGAFDWVVLLRREGTFAVPIGQKDKFLEELLRLPELPRLDLPEELHFEEVRVTPQPRLKVRPPQQPSYYGSPRLRGELSFDYDGEVVPAEKAGRGVYQAESRRFLVRDRAVESAAAAKLAELGFKAPTYGYYSQRPTDLELAPRNLPKVIHTLLSAGWHVEAEGKLYRQPGKFKIEVSSGIDWFDLHGRVDFGDTSADLPQLLAALQRGEKVVRLGDGTYGLLPEEWLKKYGLLAGLGTVEGDRLRFGRAQVGVLDALLASQPEATCDETFARVRDELRRFEGVQPMDPPADFVGELRGYQRDGLGWLHFLRQFNFGGCLADDMGLGKTVQVLALLEARRGLRDAAVNAVVAGSPDPATPADRRSPVGRHEAETSGRGGGPVGRPGHNGGGPGHNGELRHGPVNGERPAPSLVVVPKSLVFNWKEEAARFTPKLRVLDHTGADRVPPGEHFHGYDVVLTTYGTLRRDALGFRDFEFDYCILDEAQAIKNAASESAKAARLVKARHRLAMSGTPVENHLGELWSLFEFLNPGMLGSASVFRLGTQASRQVDPETRALLARALRPFILRRTKEQVARDLPQKLEQTIYCEMEPAQRKLYDELREHYRLSLLARVERDGLNKSKMQILEALLRLRQAACHPGLIDKKKTKESSAKLDALLPQLTEVLDEGHKILVFSQFTSMLAIVRERLDKDGVVYEYLDGKTRDRAKRVERFQNDPDCKLFLISLKAGGLGLNLTAAEYVFLLDPWWNPAVEAQAIDRTHRIGQTRPVFAYRLIAKGTVEEKVLELQQGKRELADAIINADNSLIRNLGREDLELLLS